MQGSALLTTPHPPRAWASDFTDGQLDTQGGNPLNGLDQVKVHFVLRIRPTRKQIQLLGEALHLPGQHPFDSRQVLPEGPLRYAPNIPIDSLLTFQSKSYMAYRGPHIKVWRGVGYGGAGLLHWGDCRAGAPGHINVPYACDRGYWYPGEGWSSGSGRSPPNTSWVHDVTYFLFKNLYG